MRIILIHDLKRQRAALVRRGRQVVLFFLLWLLADRFLAFGLLQGVEKYFGLDVPSRVLLVGYSHLELGIDKVAMEQALHVPVAKYTLAGATLSDRRVMVKHYLIRHPHSVDTLIFGVDSHLFSTKGLSVNSYKLFYPFMAKEKIVDAYVRNQAASYSEYLLRRIVALTRYNDTTLGLAVRGYLHNWKNYKHGAVNIDLLKLQIEQGKYPKASFDQKQVEIFYDILRFAREHGIKVILLYVPTLDLYNEVEPEKYEQADHFFRALAENDSGIYYLNYNDSFSHNHAIFRDPVHVNAEGQKLVTMRLLEDLKQLKVLNADE